MGGAVPPFPQYAFMAWCSVRGSTGTTLPFTFYYVKSNYYKKEKRCIPLSGTTEYMNIIIMNCYLYVNDTGTCIYIT
jgi:hypothetical protein